jgi:hypothetical protein
VTPAHPARREAWWHLDINFFDTAQAEIDHIMAGAVPVGGPTPEGMS